MFDEFDAPSPPTLLHRSLLKQTDKEYIAFEVARNKVGPDLPAHELLPSLGITEEELITLSADKSFVRLVRGFVKRLTEEGTGFKLKAQIAVEATLPVLYEIANDPGEATGMRMKAIDQLADYAGFKAAGGVDGNRPQVPAFQINFNLGSVNVPGTVQINHEDYE